MPLSPHDLPETIRQLLLGYAESEKAFCCDTQTATFEVLNMMMDIFEVMGGKIVTVMDVCERNSGFMVKYFREMVSRTNRCKIEIQEIGRQNYHLIRTGI